MKINNKNLFALIVTTIFALCSTSALSKQPPIDPSTIYVLAIGSCPPWQKIKAVCKNDVDLFASTLETNMGIPRGNIKKLIDSDATYKGVVKGFKWLTETVSENDSVIVYYNGHGMLLDLDGSQKE
ncbi:MAG: caspase family protein, partial [Thermodesulfobacteriota bacterium]